MTSDLTTNLDVRISTNPKVCHGQPVIKGTRIMVWLILDYLANGDSAEEILTAYPEINFEDIQACLSFAAKAAKVRIVPIEVKSHAF